MQVSNYTVIYHKGKEIKCRKFKISIILPLASSIVGMQTIVGSN